MVLSASGNFADAAGDAVATRNFTLGCSAVLVGTMLHAAMFVYSELAIREAGIDIIVLCASMGTMETLVLIVWNLSLLATHGVALYRPSGQVINDASALQLAMLYATITVVNACHAWAFFNMLEQVGAVTSAIMKGLQLVLVFSFSVSFFCEFQATQCFSWSKAAGVGVVALGLLVYAYTSGLASTAQQLQDGDRGGRNPLRSV
jgi:hypothetical protein